MRLKDQFQFVRQNMKKNRTRLFMTILATAMSVAFLIVLASVGFGLHKSIVKETLERRIVTEIEVPGKEDPNNGFRQLTDEDISYFEEIDDVKAVTRRKSLQHYMFEVDDHLTDAQAVVAHMPSETKAGLELSEGRLPKAENEVVVGYHFVENLRPNRELSEELYDEKGQIKEEFRYKEGLIGKKITMNVMKFEDGKEIKEPLEVTVVGIRKKPTKDWVYDSIVFVSEGVLKQVEEFTGTPRGMMKDPNNPDMELPDIGTDQYDQVNIYAANMEAVKDITAQLEENNYPSYSVINELKDVTSCSRLLKQD